MPTLQDKQGLEAKELSRVSLNYFFKIDSSQVNILRYLSL